MRVKASVIIPTYRREAVLINTIKSVLAQDFNSFELMVVDQSKRHDNKTEQFISSLKDKRFRYFKISPPSLPAARNLGLTKARGEIIIYIDDDVILDRGFIKAHLDTYRQFDVVAVAGRVKQKDKPVSGQLMYFRKTNFGAGNFNYLKVGYVETPLGCNMSFKKSALLKIGGFDTNYIGNAMREESDVAFRLRNLGYKTLFNPKASLFHLFFPTGGCREEKEMHDNYILYRNETLFFLRHRPKIYLPFFLAGHFLKYVLNRELISQGKVFFRLAIFIKGLILGLWVFWFPQKQLIAQSIEESTSE